MLNHHFPLMYVNLKVGGQAGSADPIETTTTQKSGDRIPWCHVLTSSHNYHCQPFPIHAFNGRSTYL